MQESALISRQNSVFSVYPGLTELSNKIWEEPEFGLQNILAKSGLNIADSWLFT
jgi:hypothetical protein